MNALVYFGAFRALEIRRVGILPRGEEEVQAAKSEAPVLTGAWCNREYLRNEAE
ncbi:hypothetical protein ACFY7Z_21280 [Streptomyces sp. NPDC012623]|uniref:hypothetical protein n=1 Tax=unclassified Streptomyces TaxID=2593676 RepID=UPI0036A03E1E